MNNIYISVSDSESLKHFGTKGQRRGVRRYQNPDGSLTPEGYYHYYGHARADSYKEKAKQDKERAKEKTRELKYKAKEAKQDAKLIKQAYKAQKAEAKRDMAATKAEADANRQMAKLEKQNRSLDDTLERNAKIAQYNMTTKIMKEQYKAQKKEIKDAKKLASTEAAKKLQDSKNALEEAKRVGASAESDYATALKVNAAQSAQKIAEAERAAKEAQKSEGQKTAEALLKKAGETFVSTAVPIATTATIGYVASKIAGEKSSNFGDWIIAGIDKKPVTAAAGILKSKAEEKKTETAAAPKTKAEKKAEAKAAKEAEKKKEPMPDEMGNKRGESVDIGGGKTARAWTHDTTTSGVHVSDPSGSGGSFLIQTGKEKGFSASSPSASAKNFASDYLKEHPGSKLSESDIYTWLYN